MASNLQKAGRAAFWSIIFYAVTNGIETHAHSAYCATPDAAGVNGHAENVVTLCRLPVAPTRSIAAKDAGRKQRGGEPNRLYHTFRSRVDEASWLSTRV
jgi:hypothetical protein